MNGKEVRGGKHIFSPDAESNDMPCLEGERSVAIMAKTGLSSEMPI